MSFLRNEKAQHESNASFCDSHTGGSCRFWSCSASRGPTMCRSSQCRCTAGYCAVHGVCTERTVKDSVSCNRNTGGSCRFMGCSSWRGAVDCLDGECVCQYGFCSADDGSCHRPKERLKAKVVPINSESKAFPTAQANLRTGLCFSGGGSRALTVTMGVLRALESLKLIPHVDAISSVSGGTWASSIYMFAKDVSIKDAKAESLYRESILMILMLLHSFGRMLFRIFLEKTRLQTT